MSAASSLPIFSSASSMPAACAAAAAPSPVPAALKNALPSSVVDDLQAIIVDYAKDIATEKQRAEIRALVRLPLADFTPSEGILQFERALASSSSAHATVYQRVVQTHSELFSWSACEAQCQRFTPTPPAAAGLGSLFERGADALAELFGQVTCDDSPEERSPTPVTPFVPAALSMNTLMEQNEALLAELFEIVQYHHREGHSAESTTKLMSVAEWCKKGAEFLERASAVVADFSTNNATRVEGFQEQQRHAATWPHSAPSKSVAEATGFTFAPHPFNQGRMICAACKVEATSLHAWQDPAKMHDPTKHTG